jgi:hypothetical protein
MHAGEPSGDGSDPYRASKWPRLYVIVALVAMFVAAAANVVLETNHEAETRALMIHEAGDLAMATATDPSLSRGRYWIASTVHDVAFGGVLIVPDLSLVNPHRFENLADVEVRVESYDPDLTAEVVGSLHGLPTVQGLGNTTGLFDFKLFRVVWSPEGTPVPVLRLWRFGDMFYFVDDRVLTVESTQ